MKPSTIRKWFHDEPKEAVTCSLAILGIVVIIPTLVGGILTILNSLISGNSLSLFDKWIVGVSTGGGLSVFITLLIMSVILVFLNYSSNEYETDQRGVRTTDAGTYGTAHIMLPEEIRKLMNCGTDLNELLDPLLGTIIESEGKEFVTIPVEAKENLFYKFNGHIIYFGISGIGKTLTFLINQLIQIVRRNESFILADPKLECHQIIGHMCQQCGYKTSVFSTKGEFMKFSMRFSMVALVCKYDIRQADGTILKYPIGYKIQPSDKVLVDMYSIDSILATQIARLLMEVSTSPNDKGNEFFKKGATELITALVIYVAASEKHIKTMNNGIPAVYDILVGGVTEIESIYASIRTTHPAYKIMKGLLEEKDGKPTEMLPSFIQNARLALSLYSSPEVEGLTKTSDINLLDLATQKTAIFIAMDDQDNTFSHLAQVMVNRAFSIVVAYADMLPEKKCPVPVNFIFEEAQNIGEIMYLAQKIATIRSRNINIIMVFQTLNKLRDIYKGDADTIVGNCNTLIFSGINDPETLEYVEFLASDETVIQRSERTSEKTFFESLHFKPQINVGEGEGKRKLITVGEARTLEDDYMIVIMRGRQPMILEKFKYFDHPFWQTYSKMTYIQDEYADWYREMLLERESNNQKQKDSRQTWMYSPECSLWTYSTGEVVDLSSKAPPILSFDVDRGKWLIDGAVMIHQLNYPIFRDGAYYYQEVPTKKIEKISGMASVAVPQKRKKRVAAIPGAQKQESTEQPYPTGINKRKRNKEGDILENQISMVEQIGTDNIWQK